MISILAACRSFSGADSLVRAGVSAVFGFRVIEDVSVQGVSEAGKVSPGAAAYVAGVISNTLMKGGTLREALEAGKAAFFQKETVKKRAENTTLDVRTSDPEDLDKTLVELASGGR